LSNIWESKHFFFPVLCVTKSLRKPV
jgi:hypothetical protein